MKDKTTEKNFQVFEKSVKWWKDYYGLKNWRFVIVHEDNEHTENSAAWCAWDIKGRIATIGLSLNWKNNVRSDYNLKKCGFHEVCEAMLSPLWVIGNPHSSEEYHYEEENHAIIRILENTIFEEHKNEC